MKKTLHVQAKAEAMPRPSTRTVMLLLVTIVVSAAGVYWLAQA